VARRAIGRIEPKTRIVAWLAVAALHGVFLAIAYHIRSSSPNEPERDDDALVWIDVMRPLISPPPIAMPRGQRIDSAPSAKSLPEHIEPDMATPARAPAPTPPRQIDWQSNAARSAQAIVEASVQERYRSFAPREQAASARTPPGVFGDGPNSTYGVAGEDAYGDPALWLDDNCFAELEKPVQTARDVFTIVSLTKCYLSLGKREANGKLFEHIKRPAAPSVPKAGTQMHELPVSPKRQLDE